MHFTLNVDKFKKCFTSFPVYQDRQRELIFKEIACWLNRRKKNTITILYSHDWRLNLQQCHLHSEVMPLHYECPHFSPNSRDIMWWRNSTPRFNSLSEWNHTLVLLRHDIIYDRRMFNWDKSNLPNNRNSLSNLIL